MKASGRWLVAAVLATAFAAGAAGAASASETEGQSDADVLAWTDERYPDLDVPTKPWTYDTSYFFALSRGLEDEDLDTVGVWACRVATVPFDVVGLPTAALAGLFGS